METRVTVPLRAGSAGKKMRKRKELDALGARGRRSHTHSSSQDGLLSESTDDPEGQGPRPEPQWAKRRPRGWARRRACVSVLRACTLVLVFACVVATTTVMWLFIDVREQATFLRNQLDQVVAGSQGVPETLQKCHSMSKQLQQNQTALFLKLNLLTTQLNNFTAQVTTISNSLNRVEERFKTSPELIKVPHDLETLTTNIATFGSQMQDLVATVSQLKEANSKLSDTTKLLQSNVTNIKQEMSNLSLPAAASPIPNIDSTIQGLNASINAVNANLTLVNTTLSKKLQWEEEEQRNHRTQIDSLMERNENVSTRLTSLQNECHAKDVHLTSLNTTVSQLTLQATKQQELMAHITSELSELEANSTILRVQLAAIKKDVASDGGSQPNLSSIFTPTAASTAVNDSLRES